MNIWSSILCCPRCPHHHASYTEEIPPREEGYDWEAEPASQPHAEEFERFTAAIVLLFTGLKHDRLHTFKWQVSACLPPFLFGPHGCLASDQSKLHTVSIVSDCLCPMRRSYPNLKSLKNLRAFSWRSILTKEELFSLGACLLANKHSLESLTLGMAQEATSGLAWSINVKNDPGIQYGFSDYVDEEVWPDVAAGLRDDTGSNGSFQIKSLCFQRLPPMPIKILDLTCLSRLTLWKVVWGFCINFLRSATKSKGIQLKTFELVGSEDASLDDDNQLRLSEAVSNFLSSFKGLQDLFLMLREPVDWIALHDSIGVHASTLVRLALHAQRENAEGQMQDDRAPLNLELLRTTAKTMRCFGVSSTTNDLVRRLLRLA